jgi:hypothetical protein
VLQRFDQHEVPDQDLQQRRSDFLVTIPGSWPSRGDNRRVIRDMDDPALALPLSCQLVNHDHAVGLVNTLNKARLPEERLPGTSGRCPDEKAQQKRAGPVRMYVTFVVSDPGINLRNEAGHGLLEADRCTEALAAHVVYVLVLLAFTELGS